MTEQRQILQEKTREVEEIKNYLTKYKVIALASLTKVRASQLQALRKKLQSHVQMHVIKNTLFKRAVDQIKDKTNMQELGEQVTGSTIYLFSDINPFKLVLLLEKSKVLTTAKAGDVAAFDVIVPAGNTGQPPGPIISQLGAVGLRTRIESGSVWINKDTLVVEKGGTISQSLAAILSKLGIKPVEAGLVLRAAYDDGLIITEEKLQLDIEETKKSILEAHLHAFSLSVSSAYPTASNIEFLLRKAHQDAYRLSVNQGIPAKETIKDIIRKAHLQAQGLKVQLEGQS